MLVVSGWVEAREDQLFAIHVAIRTRLMERTWQRVPWCPPVEHRDGWGSHFRDAARGNLGWAARPTPVYFFVLIQLAGCVVNWLTALVAGSGVPLAWLELTV